MNARALITVPLLCAVMIAFGCGPTSAGIKARGDARDRMNTFSARFTYDQAKQEFEVGQFDRAMRAIDVAIEQAPEAREFRVLRGRVFLETNRLEQAVAAFEKAIELDETFAEPHYYLGIVYQRWSNDELAHDHYRTAYELEPGNVQYLLATAESMIALGQFAEAREIVITKLAYFEHNAALRQLLGQIALLEQNPVAAAQLYGEARLLDPENAMLMEELAWVQYEAGLYGECAETINLVLFKSEEDRFDLRHLQAKCLTRLGRTAEAHNLYMTLTHQNPADLSIWIEFGALAWELGDFRRAAHCSTRIIALAPDRHEGYVLKGLFERHQGRIDEAVELFRQAANRSEGSTMPHLLLGRTLENAGKPLAALTVYAEAIRVDPDDRSAQSLYRRLYNDLQIASAEAGGG